MGKPPSRIFCKSLNIKPVADPDLKIRGEPAHPDPEIRGGALQKKRFFWPFGPQIGLKIREGRALPLDPPGDCLCLRLFFYSIFLVFNFDKSHSVRSLWMFLTQLHTIFLGRLCNVSNVQFYFAIFWQMTE